jgi:hypothetical protein
VYPYRSKTRVRPPGIEPGSKRWQRSIITIRPRALVLALTKHSNNERQNSDKLYQPSNPFLSV